VKVRNLKANHSYTRSHIVITTAVLASVKVRNLKANHSSVRFDGTESTAVLASVKVRNLKANHSRFTDTETPNIGCISKCEGTKSES